MDRPNRFLATVEARGEKRSCFVPNSGRLGELLYPGATVWVAEMDGPRRKTRLDLVLAEHRGALVSVDSRAPNRVASEAIGEGRIPELRGLTVARTEPRFGDSRFDFLLQGGGSLLLEVKGCTLVRGGVALFPDAPTLRGARHLRTLGSALGAGRAAILFLIQLGDARLLRPNRVTDPGFAEALREASYKGVEVYAYDSDVSLGGIVLNRRVPVDLEPPGAD